MDTKKVREAAEILDTYQLTKIDWKERDFRLVLERGEREKTTVMTTPNPIIKEPVSAEDIPIDEVASTDDLYNISSPLVGVFYEAPGPQENPFVQVGDFVKEGDTVCIVEAMKMINEIKSSVSGIVEKIYKRNEEPVEFDEPLIGIRHV